MVKKQNGQSAYAYFISNVPGIGQKTADLLLAEYKTPENVYLAGEKELVCLIGEKRVEAWKELKKTWDVQEQYANLEKRGIQFIHREEAAYPNRLKQIPDPPFALYVKGKVPDDARRSVAVVGARRCSAYGRHMAEELGRALALAGVQVISGMASGVDGISQRAVIDGGGETFGVLGCGVDICYPANHRQLYRDMQEHGGVISAYLPGTQPRPELFPPRNRIISGLSDAVVVVEARQQSGTLITVDMALEQGREIYCVPGRVTDRLSDGCNRLISQGAGVVLSVEDLLEKLETGSGGCSVGCSGKNMETSAYGEGDTGSEYLTRQEQMLWNLLDYNPISVEQLHIQLAACPATQDVTLGQVMELLMNLVLKGKAESVSGCYYTKK